MPKAIIYCRVSTDVQADLGTSLDTQQSACMALAQRYNYIVPDEALIREDHSGADLTRPGLERLFRLADSGHFEAVFIYTLDRLYRPDEGEEWRVFEVLHQLDKAGVRVNWVDSSIPTGGPLASVITMLDSWRAGQERAKIRERTMRGKVYTAQNGVLPVGTGKGLYGYDYVPKAADNSSSSSC